MRPTHPFNLIKLSEFFNLANVKHDNLILITILYYVVMYVIGEYVYRVAGSAFTKPPLQGCSTIAVVSPNHRQFGPLQNRPPEKSYLVKSAPLQITLVKSVPRC